MHDERFAVERRCWVERATKSNKQWRQRLPVTSVYLLVGSMCLESLGQLKHPLSDHPEVLLPVNYRSVILSFVVKYASVVLFFAVNDR